MYFRTKLVSGTPLVQLVQSFRNSEGLPRQRLLVSLGDAKILEGEKHRIARAVEQYLEGTQDLLSCELSQVATVWVARIVQLLGRSKAATPPTGSTSLR